MAEQFGNDQLPTFENGQTTRVEELELERADTDQRPRVEIGHTTRVEELECERTDTDQLPTFENGQTTRVEGLELERADTDQLPTFENGQRTRVEELALERVDTESDLERLLGNSNAAVARLQAGNIPQHTQQEILQYIRQTISRAQSLWHNMNTLNRGARAGILASLRDVETKVKAME
ncbi:uncharacterized protein LOC125656965 isoform X2 [Ostrea edulis]|uniref:uncharacterized protein LOC125656965 isoform X2 n=1 Tax=Ostrea edulis TaxID=37623 RepID=UPI00209403F9|nr:uncharacterized protein LOC125656965 isoform X2 [Ostrea edulis]XP_055998842.1 uncharacterized protein LOC125656965 isoform X2 [Ostrea edulis]